MAALVDLLRFLSIFLTGIATGTLVMLLFGLIPTIHRYSPVEGLKVHQTVEPLIDRYNPPCVALGALTAFLALALDRDRGASESLFTVIGLAGSVGVAIASVGFNARINRRL